MESTFDPYAAKALLDWQIELGATEAIGDVPVNRYEVPDTPPAAASAAARLRAAQANTAPVVAPPAAADPLADARAAAGAATTLEALREALAGYAHCDLKRGARNLVFAEGDRAARVMIIGDAPDRDEDLQGRPFVGRAGQLLDKMLEAIGMSRTAPDPGQAVYITNVLPWRPPQNRDPKPEEIAMMLPFVQRHVDLVDPEIIVLMGNISCQAGLGRQSATRLRGQWTESYGRTTLPMVHPSHLLRTPQAKREAWADLLKLQARLRGGA